MRCVWLPRKYECSHMSVLEWNVAQRENTKELHPWFYERSNAQRQHAWVCRRGIRQRNKTDVSGASFCSHVKKRIKKKVLLLLQTNNTPSWIYKGVPQCGSQQCDTLLNQPKLKELTNILLKTVEVWSYLLLHLCTATFAGWLWSVVEGRHVSEYASMPTETFLAWMFIFIYM